MIKEAIVKIVNKEDLTFDEAYAVMNEIMNGETSPTQNAAFLAALSTKSAKAETTQEIAGCAMAMREHATAVDTDFDLFEIVGTGGDNAGSFNISTTSAIVAAAGGMKVSKHGNRAASSKCGTADCLEALGVNIEEDPKKCKELLEKVGICFFFAQKYHSSMKYVGAIRKDKLDEISLSAPTKICEINKGSLTTYEIKPEDFGLTRCERQDLAGGGPKENAAITLAILNGEKGPKTDAVLLNAGAALYIGDKAGSIQEGIDLARNLIESKRALKVLEDFIRASNE